MSGNCCMVWCERTDEHAAHEPTTPEQIITAIVYCDTDWPCGFDQRSAINASRLTAERILAGLARRRFDVVEAPEGARVSVRWDRDKMIDLLNRQEADAVSHTGNEGQT